MKRMTLLWLGLAAIAVSGSVGKSGADFTHQSSSPANAFTAAADFNTVAVAITNPGTPLRGTVALQATASSERGIERVRFQSSPAGAGSWTDVCDDTSAPYTCNWNTAGVADGSRDVRALAIDQAGYQRASVIAARLIDNTLPSASLNDPGVLQGTETLTATGSDAGSGLASLAIEYRPAGGSWTTLCSGATSPRSCPLNTTTLTDGSYELRARATDAAGNQRDTTTLTRTVDNTAPTVSVVVPPAPLRGTATVAMNAGDAGTGVTGVSLEFRAAGGGGWAPVCSDTTVPYECAGLDTTQVPDGVYEGRAVATDGAGFSTTSATASIRIDNTEPTTATLDAVPATISGTRAVTGSAADGATGSGVAAWIAQYSPAGAGIWTNACSDTVTPFTTCSWATTALMDGRYDVRALVRDLAGNETPSSVQTNRVIDNDTTPTGTDVQTANGGATAGRLDAGDTLTLTYSEPINPTTIQSSFTGVSMTIRVTATNSASNDRLAIATTGGQAINLATDLRLGGNYVTNTVVFTATMVQTGNTIVITLGAPNRTDRFVTQTASGTLSWAPSSAARDWANHAVGTAAVPETGTADREF